MPFACARDLTLFDVLREWDTYRLTGMSQGLHELCDPRAILTLQPDIEVALAHVPATSISKLVLSRDGPTNRLMRR